VSALRRVAVLPIVVYQRTLSRALPPRCRYYPSCSEYAVQAIGAHGILRGSVLAAWRVLRCNPWSLGGVDHVHEQTLFPLRRRDRVAATSHEAQAH
jgi:uncharacterized protein